MVKITKNIALNLAHKYFIDLRKIPIKDWKFALQVELEHGTKHKLTNVTDNDLDLTAKIVIAHLLEFPDYYVRLKEMEREAELYWKTKPKKNIFRKNAQ